MRGRSSLQPMANHGLQRVLHPKTSAIILDDVRHNLGSVSTTYGGHYRPNHHVCCNRSTFSPSARNKCDGKNFLDASSSTIADYTLHLVEVNEIFTNCWAILIKHDFLKLNSCEQGSRDDRNGIFGSGWRAGCPHPVQIKEVDKNLRHKVCVY
jgi:hypothetical protein